MESGDDAPPQPRLSRAAAYRLSQYLRCLSAPLTSPVSSLELARFVGVGDAQVRRDLAALGHLGQRGIGYDRTALRMAICRGLGIDRSWRAVLVGVGNLARALLRYPGFAAQGFQIVGLFDHDPQLIGQHHERLTIESVECLPQRTQELHAELGILTVPASAAQAVAEQLVLGGVTGLLNFASVQLRLAPSVQVVSVDLTIQLEHLAFLVQQQRFRFE